VADLQWLGVNLLSGQIIADLADVELTEPLAVTIGQYEQTRVYLNVEPNTPADWLAATQPGGTALIAWTGQPLAPNIVWGGIVQQRARTLGNKVELALITPEGYLEACPVGTYNAAGLNQDTILSSLMAFAAGTYRPSIILNQLTPSTNVQTVAYTPSSQASVYTALQALSGVTNGPEWTMDWYWDLVARTIRPRLNYGARVGNPVQAGGLPNVTVELEDLQDGSSFVEDYSPGHGANDVTAFGAPDPNATAADIASAQATAGDLKGRPLWSYVYQPNQTVTTSGALAPYATAAVAQMQDGAQPLSMVLLNNAPGKQLGVDWFLGDDLGWSLDGPTFPVPVAGTARCIGYTATTQTITPMLKGASLG
jgi:hypothetical protein